MSARGVRRVTAVSFSLLSALLLLVGCAGQQEEKGAAPIAGSFVGEAPDADSFIAIVADVPEGDSNEREVKAYLCDGQTVSDWFVGSVEGNDLNLSSGSGAQLVGQLTSNAATGTITDPLGESVSFEAPLATGIAGLYNVNVASDGTLSGTSQTGGQLEGQLGNILEEYETYPVSGTITPPDGEAQDFKALTSPNTSDQHRWIVLQDGRIKGGNVVVGGDFEFGGFDFDRRFDCDFDDFDDFDFDDCDFDFNQFVFVTNFDRFDFDHRDFDHRDFDHGFDFDRDFDFEFNRDRVGGTFGQVGGGRGGDQGGGKGGGQGGGGGKGSGGGGKGGGGQGGGGGKGS